MAKKTMSGGNPFASHPTPAHNPLPKGAGNGVKGPKPTPPPPGSKSPKKAKYV